MTPNHQNAGHTFDDDEEKAIYREIAEYRETAEYKANLQRQRIAAAEWHKRNREANR